MKKNFNFFMSRRVLEKNTQNNIWYNTNYVKKDNVFSQNIVVSEDFKITDLMVSARPNYGQYIKPNRQQANINVCVRCFAVIFVQKIYEFFLWHLIIFALTFTFYVSIFLYLSVINFTPIIRVLVVETQSLAMLICIW